MATTRVIVLGSRGVVDYMQVKKKTFGGAIDDAGLRNASLARKVGCTAQYIGALRRGERTSVSPQMGIKIASALGVRVDAIFIPCEAPTSEGAA